MKSIDKELLKNIEKITLDVLLYIFIVLCLISVIFTIASKKDEDGTAVIFGTQLRIVTSDSMAKCDETDVSDFDIKSIPIRSLIFVEVVPEDEDEAYEWYKDLDEGDVLTFKYFYTEQVVITHRITKITEKKTGGFIIELAGDNKNSDNDVLYQIIDTSDTNSPNYVIGKVTGKTHFFGLILSLFKSTVGMILIVIVPCLIIITMEVIKILNVVGADKKKQKIEEQQQKDKELEELRKKVAELEAKKENNEEGE